MSHISTRKTGRKKSGLQAQTVHGPQQSALLRAKPPSLDYEDLRHSVISTSQNIERTGKTSQKTAEKLADYFNVDIADLQGLKPLDTI